TLACEQSFANKSGKRVAGSVNVVVDRGPRVRTNECHAVSIPNLDPCIFGLRMDVEYPPARLQPAMNSVQDMHDVLCRYSSYGPGKQHHIESFCRQIDRDDVRVAE